MKTTFTLFLLCGIVSLSIAQNPFSKRADKQARQSVQTLKKVQAGHLPTSVITDWWNNNNWESSTTTALSYTAEGLIWIEESSNSKNTYTYYVDGMLKEKISQLWGGSNWTNQTKKTYVYDSEGNESERIYYDWIGGIWVMSSGNRMETTYDGEGDVLSEISSYYNAGTMMWEESYGYKSEYTYSNGLLTEQIEYDRQGGAWVIEMKLTWQYDVDDKLEGGLIYEHDGSNYNLMGRYTEVIWEWWDPAGHVETSLVQTYTQQTYGGPAYPNEEPENNSHYMNAEKADATYPGGLGGGTPPTTIEISQTWNGSMWVNSEKWTWEQMADYESYLDESWDGSLWLKVEFNKDYETATLSYYEYHQYDDLGVMTSASKYSKSYDSFGNLTEDKSEAHNGDGNWAQDWGQKVIITYDGGTDDILIRITQLWDNDTDMYINNMRERFDYSATNLEAIETKGIKIFPTAFRNNLAVQSAFEGHAYIYNLSGALVKEQVISVGENRIESADLDKGYYLIKVSTKEGDAIQKVIKR